MHHYVLGNNDVSVTISGSGDTLWSYTLRESGFRIPLGHPIVEIDGEAVACRFVPNEHSQRQIRGSIVEHRIAGPLSALPEVQLAIIIRVSEGSAIVRLRYELVGIGRLTKSAGRDAIELIKTSVLDDDLITEVRLSDFDTLVHSYRIAEMPLGAGSEDRPTTAVGPIVTLGRADHTIILAYEHGAQSPDAFLEFAITGESLTLRATKGTHLDRQPLPYSTAWLLVGAVAGDHDSAARAFRAFILDHQSEASESRQPWVFYNTWAMQERAKWWHGGQYLDPMRQDTVLAEIDVAHEIGVEVFVIDTGWYRKTGDWEVDPERFSDRLGVVRDRLDQHGMRLGLWFGPTNAAVSSTIVVARPELQMSWKSVRPTPREIWETEESVFMCLVSDYAQYFAEQLIRLHHETGVTYFKWDAVGQYGCDDPGHDHGDESHSAQERADSYAYQLPLALAAIAATVVEAVPEAIVDFDVTESGRSVGLSFLSVGKYFLINNGPYTSSFDMPDLKGNTNLLFYPGPARARNARVTTEFDRWIPLSLFLCHYLPDDPTAFQTVNIGSLMLGHGGIWGELSGLSAEGRSAIHEITQHYSSVRGYMRAADPVVTGRIGGSPEIHEKITAGRGAVIAFSPFAQSARYVTRNRVSTGIWHTPGARVTIREDGHAEIDIIFTDDGAVIVCFT